MALSIGTRVTVSDNYSGSDAGRTGTVIGTGSSDDLWVVALDGENMGWQWHASSLVDMSNGAHDVDPVIPFATGELLTVDPRPYRVARFARVTVVLWTAREGTHTVDGVHGVYVNANRDRITLVRGKYGPAVRFGVETNVISIFKTATGEACDSHPVDDASALLSITASDG